MDIFKDYMNALLGALLILIPLIREVTKGQKKGKRKVTPYLIFLIVSFGLLVYFGIDKINRDAKEKRLADNSKRKSEERIDTLSNNIVELTQLNKDNLEFMKRLKDKFSIVKDSANEPRKIIYNTNIDKARDVYIGND